MNEPLYIIKIGGNVLDNEAVLQMFLADFAIIKGLKILVHGGGKIATKLGQQLGIEPNFINGRRITDDGTINLVTMVYGGLVNKQLVASLQQLGCNAIGLTGADANIIPAAKRPVKETDFGWVGDVNERDIPAPTLQLFLNNGLVPVLAPLTHDQQGHMLNTNADTIASAVAVALSAIYTTRLIYCFEKKGVLEDVNNEASVIPLINQQSYQSLLADGKLFDGILPKLHNAFKAINAGVHEVLIGDAKDILQNTTTQTNGTLIKQ